MYLVYGNSSWYIHGGPFFGEGPLLGGSVIVTCLRIVRCSFTDECTMECPFK